MPDDLPEIFGVCRGCGHVYTTEPEDPPYCLTCGNCEWPLSPAEAEARVHANRVARARAKTQGGEIDFAGLTIKLDDSQKEPSRPIIAMSGRTIGKSRMSSAVAQQLRAGDMMVYDNQKFGVVRDVSIDGSGSHVEIIRDWKSEEDR